MIIFDTETTELVKPDVADLATQPYAIEIAALKVAPVTYKVQGTFHHLLKPGKPLNDEEHKTMTGLTNADLEDKPMFLEVVEELTAFVHGEWTWIAHNFQFDLSVLVAELRRVGREFSFPYPPKAICTVDITKHLRGRRLKLTELYELKVGKLLKQDHRAKSDAEALLAVVKAMKLS